MDINDLKLNLLLEQRKLLISEIKELYSNISKTVIALIPIIATLVVSYTNVISSKNSLVIRFVILDSMIILSMIISMCLFCANIKRDYIAAIDIHLFNVYGIRELFCNGELSKKHITGVNGVFPIMAITSGISIASSIVLLMCYVISQDLIFYINHKFILVVFAIQIFGYIVVILMNFYRKIFKKSTITNDCLKYFTRD